LPAEKALDEIIHLKGKSFDPDLVDIFVQIFSNILMIKDPFSEKNG